MSLKEISFFSTGGHYIVKCLGIYLRMTKTIAKSVDYTGSGSTVKGLMMEPMYCTSVLTWASCFRTIKHEAKHRRESLQSIYQHTVCDVGSTVVEAATTTIK